MFFDSTTRTRPGLVLPVAVALAAMVLAAACGSAPTPKSPPAPTGPEPHAAWAMFRGTADHRGVANTPRPPRWRLRWKVDLGERVDASAVITGREQVFVATRKGLVTLLDLETGASVVRRRLGAGVWSSPAQAGDRLVVATRDGKIHGLDVRTLRPIWASEVVATSFSAISVVGERVFLTADSELLALNPASGAISLRVALDATSFTAPAHDAGRNLIVVGDRSGGVYAFDAATGERRWRAVTTEGAHNDGSPTIAGDRVLIGSNDGGLHAFALDDGAPLWTARGDHWVVSTAAVTDDLAVYGDDGGFLRAVALADGSEQWVVRVGADLASSPTIVGDRVVHGAHDSSIHSHALDGTGGEFIDAGAPVYASPAVAADGAIIVASQRGRVLAIE